MSHTLLAVDDSPENLDLIKSILEPHYSVKVALHGELALQIAKSQKPDLILLDVMLDDISGFEVCQRLKNDDSTRDIPIIFLTAMRTEADEIKGFKIGGCDYITKPFSPDIMLARVRTQIQLKEKTDLLEKLASLDGLTEIPNRRAFDNALSRQFSQTQRTRIPLSLLLMDIDHFKQFNDYFGHPAGDECLKRVAKKLVDETERPEDLVARLGGEEFAILLPSTDFTSAMLRAERYRESIAALQIQHVQDHIPPYITVSIGVATWSSEPHSSPVRLLESADDALYQAKKQGRNRVCSSQFHPCSPLNSVKYR